MSKRTQALDYRGIAPIIAEIILISLIVIAMTTIAAQMTSNVPTPKRNVELDVRLENTNIDDNKVIRVVLTHRGGDTIKEPTNSKQGLRVLGGKSGWDSWENQVPFDNWTLSNPAHGLELSENMVGYLRHENANVSAGDKLYITVTDLYAEKIIIDQRTCTVQEPY